MSNLIKELVGNFNLKKEIDWGLVGVIADAFREEGEELLADYLQWCWESNTRCWPPKDNSPYSFMYGHSGLCKNIPLHLQKYKGSFHTYFLFDYFNSVLSFLELNMGPGHIILPDYCLPVTVKMWPNYSCKGKTLGQIKEELSNV